MVLSSPARNEPRSGLLQMSGGRVFQTVAIRGRSSVCESLCLILGMSICVSELDGQY